MKCPTAPSTIVAVLFSSYVSSFSPRQLRPPRISFRELRKDTGEIEELSEPWDERFPENLEYLFRSAGFGSIKPPNYHQPAGMPKAFVTLHRTLLVSDAPAAKLLMKHLIAAACVDKDCLYQGKLSFT